MAVLGAVIMSLACVFLGYCGLQFHAELKRSRSKLTCYGLSAVESRTSANTIEIPGRAIAIQMPQLVRLTERAVGDRKRSAANRVLMYPTKRAAAVHSEKEPLAPKRVAKG